ncbi:MAG: PD-(D/E)XK nuclease family transposase [Bacillota bacterium]|nr:PD-(D/E)XK nuclease family transposase [Bacillota bacterium]
MELSKFKKVQPDFKKPIDRWLLFLEDSPKEVLEMAIKEEPAIERAEKVLEYLGTNEEMIRFYELREKQIHDEITRITGTKLEIARKMKSKGIDDSTISEVTGLTLEELKEIQSH